MGLLKVQEKELRVKRFMEINKEEKLKGVYIKIRMR